MPRYRAEIKVLRKDGILEPQGQLVEKYLEAAIGPHGISQVVFGKFITLAVEAATEVDAADQVERACKEPLTNPVLERYDFQLVEIPIEGRS